MSKKETTKEAPAKEKTPKIGNFELVNAVKVDRALNGNLMNDGNVSGGVKKTDGTYDSLELLVEYDRIGGYIKDEEGNKIKNGSFYNFKTKKAHDKPQIVRIFRINGEPVEVAEGEKTPSIVEAQKQYDKSKETLDEDKKKAKAKPRQVSKKIKI